MSTLTASDVDRAVCLYTSGLTLREVGDRLGTSNVTIMKHLDRRGIERRSKRQHHQVALQTIRLLKAWLWHGTMREAADELQVSLDQCRSLLKQTGASRKVRLDELHVLTEEGWEELEAALDEGLEYEDAIELALAYCERSSVDRNVRPCF